MRAANGGNCQACGEGFENGEVFYHFHRNVRVVVLFHDECLMPYMKERFASPVGLPLPCGCDLEHDDPVDQLVFGGV
jgi:hypothetical protein